MSQATQPISRDDRAKRRKDIADAIKAGNTVAQVCRQFGVSIWTIRGACHEHGVPFSVAPVQSVA